MMTGMDEFSDDYVVAVVDGPCVGNNPVPGHVFRGVRDLNRLMIELTAPDGGRHDYRYVNGCFRHIGPSAPPSQCGKKLPPGHGWCYEPYGHEPPHLDCGGHEFTDEACDVREPDTETVSFTVGLGSGPVGR